MPVIVEKIDKKEFRKFVIIIGNTYRDNNKIVGPKLGKHLTEQDITLDRSGASKKRSSKKRNTYYNNKNNNKAAGDSEDNRERKKVNKHKRLAAE